MEENLTLPSSVSTMHSPGELSIYMLTNILDKVGNSMAWFSNIVLARCNATCSMHLVSLSVSGSCSQIEMKVSSWPLLPFSGLQLDLQIVNCLL